MPPHSSGAVEPLTRAPMRRGAAHASPRGGPPGAPLGQQRSEFEDFMNAYRPTLELPPREEPPLPRQPPEPRVDFGRSIKKLMKRPQGSPNMQNKNQNRKEGVQRTLAPTTSAPLERERSFTSDVQPVVDKKPKRPLSANVDPVSLPPTPPHLQPPPVDVPPPPKPEPPPPPVHKNSKLTLKVPKVELDEQLKGMQPVVPGESPGGPPVPGGKKKVSVQEERWRADDAHCLIISGNNIGRFLPTRHNPDPILSMRVVPIPERKYNVIMEFEESPEPPKIPLSTSGLMVITPEENPYLCQEQMNFFSWIRESHVATMGMLLMNVERITEFPFVTYLVVNGSRHELSQKLHCVDSKPISSRLRQLQFLAGYEETITIARPPLPPTFPEKPASDKTGYVISLYQVLPGEDGLRFEQNWVIWTGARQIYRTVPDYMGLKRISVHKSVLPSKVINYSLVCEFSNIMDHLTDACVIIDHLRARCCGFTGIYRVLDTI